MNNTKRKSDKFYPNKTNPNPDSSTAASDDSDSSYISKQNHPAKSESEQNDKTWSHLKSKKLFSKRFYLKRSDSGLSSDSGEVQSLQPSLIAKPDQLDGTSEKDEIFADSVQSLFSELNTTNMSEEDLFDISSSIAKNSDHLSQPYECDTFRRHSSPHYRFDQCQQHFDMSASVHLDYLKRPIDSYTFDDIYLYESKISELTSQKELMSRKLLYMEEHIIDLSSENESVRKKLSTQEEFYKKKIEFREDEIESLKETILQLEEKITELRLKEKELLQQKSLLASDVKVLKQQISTQEGELIRLQNSHQKLAELESANQKANQTIEALRNDKCDTINQLEEAFRSQCAAKDLEIVTLNHRIDELSQLVARTVQQDSTVVCTGIGGLHSRQTVVPNQLRHRANSVAGSHNNSQIGPIGTCVNLPPSSLSSALSPPSNIVSSSLSFPSSSADRRPMTFCAYKHLPLHSDCSAEMMDVTTDMNNGDDKSKRPIQRNFSCDTDEDYDELGGLVAQPATTTDTVSQQSVASDQFIEQSHHRHDHNHINGASLLTELDANNNKTYTPKVSRSRTGSKSESKVEGELFPSLPDVMLRKLCLLRENTCSIESLSEQEIDSKFHTLSLAFKTDKFTLDQRVNLYRHQRDVAETDAKTELTNLTEYIQELHRLLFSCDSKFFFKSNLTQLREFKEMLDKIEMQTQVLQASVMKISSRSELYGAVRQEEKLSTAFDVILLHLENLKRAKERDAKELEDVKRLLVTSGFKDELDNGVDSDHYTPHHRRSIRSISTSSKFNLIRVRRASVASIDIMPKDLSTRRFGVIPNTNTSLIPNTTLQVAGSSGPGQKYLKSRRLSVPAAEIRSRPKLLQILSESSNRLSVTEEESKNDSPKDVHEDGETSKENSDNDDDTLLTTPEANRKKLSITPINPLESIADMVGSCDSINHKDMDLDSPTIENHSVIYDKRNSREDKFYKELIQRLEPLEEMQTHRSMTRKFKDKIKQVYKSANEIFWVLVVKRITDRFYNSYIVKYSKNSYDEIRYLISALLVFTSIVIVFWSIILPLMFS